MEPALRFAIALVLFAFVTFCFGSALWMAWTAARARSFAPNRRKCSCGLLVDECPNREFFE
jgi:hypothetical protein